MASKKTSKKPPTLVVFRSWLHEPGVVLAVFPNISADKHGKRIRPTLRNSGIALCFEYVSQNAASPHLRAGLRKSGENYVDIMSRTRPAKSVEYAYLKSELEKLGYNLSVARYAV